MAINFPTSLDNFTNPVSGNTLDSPSHSLQHSDLNDAVEALETKLGVGSSPAGSATAGQVLTAQGGGTALWATPSQGLTLIKTQSFSAVASSSVNDVFSATYDNYRVYVVTGDPATSQLFTMRLRVAGADDSSSNYFRMNFGRASDGTTTSLLGNATSWALGHVGTGSEFASSFDIYDPFASTLRTSLAGFSNGNNSAYNSVTGYTLNNWFNATTSFTGFTLLFGANTTGTVSVYGVNK